MKIEIKDSVKQIILSIDGGGTRGLMESIMLTSIESELRKKHGSNVRLIDYVDIITGASTGGIIAALLSHPNRYSAEDVMNFYNKYCYEIFNKSKKRFHTGLVNSSKYKVDNLERILKKYFGTLRMRDLKGHVMISAQNLIDSEAVFFSNKKQSNKMLETFYVWEVLRATSAAPTYFDAKELNTINGLHSVVCEDGGMIANDMSMCAIAKVQKYNKDIDIKDISVINIGSGAQAPKTKNPSKPKGLLTVAKKLPLRMLYGNVNIVKYQCMQFNLEKYYSLDIPKEYRCYSDDMADAGRDNMQRMRNAAFKSIKKQDTEIKSIIKFLSKSKINTKSIEVTK